MLHACVRTFDVISTVEILLGTKQGPNETNPDSDGTDPWATGMGSAGIVARSELGLGWARNVAAAAVSR